MKKILALVLSIVTISLVVFSVKAYATVDHTNGQVDICHFTESHYVQNSPNKSGDVGGHNGHGNDIIPPFDYWQHFNPPGPNNDFWLLLPYLGKNWDEEGQAIWNNNCEVPPTDVCLNLEGVQESTPEGYTNNDGTCTPVVIEEPSCEELKNCEEETPEEPGQPGTPTDVVFVSQNNTPGTCEVKIGALTPANFHIYRFEGKVIAKWVPDYSQGNEVVIWYGHNGKGIEYSTIRSNTGNETINVFDSGDYTFWLSYKAGCFVGEKTQAVIDGATSQWILFTQTP